MHILPVSPTSPPDRRTTLPTFFWSPTSHTGLKIRLRIVIGTTHYPYEILWPEYLGHSSMPSCKSDSVFWHVQDVPTPSWNHSVLVWWRRQISMTARKRNGDIPATSSRTANMSPRRQFAAEFLPVRVIVVVWWFHEGGTEQRESVGLSVWAIPDFDKQPPRGEGRSKESGNKRRDGAGWCHTFTSASHSVWDLLTQVVVISV